MVLSQTQCLVQALGAILAQPSPSELAPMDQGRPTQSSGPGSLLELASFPLLCGDMWCGMCWHRSTSAGASTPPPAPWQVLGRLLQGWGCS